MEKAKAGVENMELNEASVRDILLRNIADRNKTLASIIYAVNCGDGKEYSNSFTSVVRAFVGNNRNAMNDIESIVERFDGKYAPYHFFDNDTLWAYDGYLGVLINEIWGKNLTPAELDRAFNKAGQYMIKHSGTASSNFYNVHKPIVCVKKETPNGKVYAPRKPLTEKQFIKKYGVTSTSCVNDIQKHFMWERGRLASTKQKHSSKTDDSNLIRYNYNGHTCVLMVNRVKNYCGEDGLPVRVITASGKDGVLYTTRTSDGKKYNGILYELDGYEVAKDDEAGEVFYPSKTLEIKEYVEKTQNQTSNVVEYSEDDQMRWF